jgi:hypothetical protein
MVAAVELNGELGIPLIATDEEIEMGLKPVPLKLSDNAQAVQVNDVGESHLGINGQTPLVSRGLDLFMGHFLVAVQQPQHAPILLALALTADGKHGSMKPEGRTRNMGSQWAAHGPGRAGDVGRAGAGRGLVRRTRLPTHGPRRPGDIGRGGASLRTGGGKRRLRQHGEHGKQDGGEGH